MFHVEQETTSIFKNSLPFVRLYAILTIVRKMENSEFSQARRLVKIPILKKRKQLPKIWQLSEVPRELRYF